MTLRMNFLFFLINCLSPVIAIADWQNPVVIDSGQSHYVGLTIKARNDTVYVSFNNVVVRSLDGGATWQDRYEFGNSIRLDQNSELQGDTLVAYGAYSFHFSTDNGYSWQEPRIFDSWAGYHSYCRSGDSLYQCANVDISYEQSEIGFAKSLNFGENWPFPQLIYIYEHHAGSEIYRYFGRLFILSYVDSPFLYYSNLRLNYSLNDGENWTSIDSLTPTIYGYGEPRLAASSNGRMAFIYHIWEPNLPRDSSFVQISISADSGATWSPPIDISYTRFNHTPRMATNGDTIVACWYSNGMVVRRSYDFGQTWQDAEFIGGADGDIALDDNIVHLVYGSTGHRLLYRRWEPGTDATDDHNTPASFSLSPAYPNPFNAATTIEYILPAAGNVRLDIYDILGRKIGTLVNGNQSAGRHQAVWNAGAEPSGIYFYRLRIENDTGWGKMILLK